MRGARSAGDPDATNNRSPERSPDPNRFPERSAEGAKSKGQASDATSTNETAAHGIKTQSGDPKVPGTLTHLQSTARARANLFEALLEAVKYNSLGQISHALYDVGGEYRRNM